MLRQRFCKSLFIATLALGTATVTLSGCSSNPATGKQQFTGLMSPEQEKQIGAEEHQKVIKQFGLYNDPDLQSYVSSIGARVSKDTERNDVKYKFYVIDSDVVNAFALPGGYVYVSRGLLALANTEAELAAVLGHEVGHITGRHSAERYSRGALATIGAQVVSMAIDVPGASQALGLGTNLYLSSYSRSQENEADSLGLRYMDRGGYDVDEMTAFLTSMNANSALEQKLEGRSGADPAASYFSTHPPTVDRISNTRAQAKQYGGNGAVGENTYLAAINGIPFGDSEAQGFQQGNTFVHPELGFKFDVPNGYKVSNQPSQIVVTGSNGTAMVFDMDKVDAETDAPTYLQQLWLKGKGGASVERATINGMNAATTSFSGEVNGRKATIRLIAIQFSKNTFARFQIAIPDGTSNAVVEDLKRSTYSFGRLSSSEKSRYKAKRIRVFTAGSGDSVASVASRMPFTDYKEERFRTLNGLVSGESLVAGRKYKTIVQ